MSTPRHQPDRGPVSASADSDARREPFELAHLIAAGDIDVVPGDPPVPIAIWRVAAIDAPYDHDLADGLTPRMAALLVGCYTRPGDSIVSVGHDPTLAGAAGAGARTYLAVQDPADLADVDHVTGTVRLVVLRWPPARRPHPVSPTEATDLFTACRVITGRDGCTIVAFAPLEPDDTYAEHSGLLVPAARHAGLGLLQHIVAITAPIAGETHHLAGRPRRPCHAAGRHPRQDPCRPACLRFAAGPPWLTRATRMSHRPARPPTACRRPPMKTPRACRCCRSSWSCSAAWPCSGAAGSRPGPARTRPGWPPTWPPP